MFSAAVLARLEEDLDLRIVDHFDLIAGTSTGGIIALALGLGMSPGRSCEFYTEPRPTDLPRPEQAARRTPPPPSQVRGGAAARRAHRGARASENSARAQSAW